MNWQDEQKKVATGVTGGQEPVAQCMVHGECFGGKCIYIHSQPKREWIGLTDEEIADLMDVVDHYNFPEDLIVYTQAKLREKNT